MTATVEEPGRRVPGLVPGRDPLRVGRFSGVWRPRTIVVMVATAAVLVVGAALNIGRGEFPIGVGDVLATLFGGGGPAEQFIVLDLRLPRTLTGALVGGALGVSGAILQALARNPLAAPDIIGITMGASAAAVGVIVLGSGAGAFAVIASSVGLPVAALLGGLVTATLIYLLAWRKGVQGFRLVLVGIGMNAILYALVNWLLIAAQVYEAARAQVWLNGSLNARGWEHVVPVGIALAILVPVALVLAHLLGALQYNDDTARSLGVRVDGARTALLAVAVGLAAIATASAGPIAFVALVSPQIAQRLVGSPRPPIGASLLIGATLVVLSDLLARTAFGSAELPVGVVTAVLGAPYLLYLLVRHGREARV
ncbi:MAG: iron chelate uptake ABC transporter family permease subunit [Pseudonocardia sp.]|uniref:FecCD family ABC transporter permease n=1 Tax=Pseudonocardia sp. TaxID=60912 RepID=UPI00086895AA|nr:iron chelate uptake ABC transporter family permease subunit [Pseudonocardia sp.]MBN9107886.1 iron chelate uptake ABC transporter family permease subunit [Pseudonocardia sp.]ODU23397.1 MAG: iron ABC transporter [Pseudonocardia sp. SCN 72-51]